MLSRVNTGRGTIPAIVVAAIWSLSLTVNLPGLAVTPMLDSLKEIFGNVSEAEVQLLTVLPNVLIIPFVLLGGRLSESRHKKAIVVISLAVYLAAGILYFFTRTMTGLIIVSCLLGVGCGALIPFSTGLVADIFVGKYRMRQMGIISAIGNLALVAATLAVGFLADISWHLPFLVYLIPLIPLALSPWLPNDKVTDDPPVPAAGAESPRRDQSAFNVGRTIWLVLSYFLFMGITAVVLNFLPFTMEGYMRMSSGAVGTVTSLLFVGMMAAGFILTPTLKLLKQWTYVASVGLLVGGLALMTFARVDIAIGAGAFIMGLAVGTIQPVIYDKATEVVNDQSKATLALAIIMAANYAAVSLSPEIVDFLQWATGIKSAMFPFYLDLGIAVVTLVIAITRHRRFIFGINPKYYS